jgi:hypothetical protein
MVHLSATLPMMSFTSASIAGSTSCGIGSRQSRENFDDT